MELKNQTKKFTHILVIIILSIVVICYFYFESVLLAVFSLKPKIFSEKIQNPRNALKTQDLGLKPQVWQP